MKVRKKPIILDACTVSLDMVRHGAPWVLEAFNKQTLRLSPSGMGVLVKTPEGEMLGEFGDIIIKGVAGELYPCKRRVFDATYEIVPS